MSRIVKESLGTIIKRAMKEKGLNQSAIAAKMNMKRQSLNQIDQRKTFDLEFLQQLKEASGLDFTHYNFKNEPQYKLEDPSVAYGSSQNQQAQVEMALTIKIKSEPDQLSKIGDLILVIRREAKQMGFTVI